MADIENYYQNKLLENGFHEESSNNSFVGTILVAGLSGLVGSKLLKKQFEKAGITA